MTMLEWIDRQLKELEHEAAKLEGRRTALWEARHVADRIENAG